MIRIHHLGPTRGMRIIWQCEEMGLPYEVIQQSFPVSAEYRALNPMGALPFLEDGPENQRIGINESVAMMLYLAMKYGPTPLLPGKDDPALARTLQFLVFGEATLGAWGNAVMVTHLFAPAEQKSNFTADTARARLAAGFGYAASMLGDQPYLAGKDFTLADISVAYTIGVARAYFGGDDTLPKNLLAYHDRLKERPAYQRAAAK
jgi:glutathione S-transferase